MKRPVLFVFHTFYCIPFEDRPSSLYRISIWGMLPRCCILSWSAMQSTVLIHPKMAGLPCWLSAVRTCTSCNNFNWWSKRCMGCNMVHRFSRKPTCCIAWKSSGLHRIYWLCLAQSSRLAIFESIFAWYIDNRFEQLGTDIRGDALEWLLQERSTITPHSQLVSTQSLPLRDATWVLLEKATNFPLHCLNRSVCTAPTAHHSATKPWDQIERVDARCILQPREHIWSSIRLQGFRIVAWQWHNVLTLPDAGKLQYQKLLLMTCWKPVLLTRIFNKNFSWLSSCQAWSFK